MFKLVPVGILTSTNQNRLPSGYCPIRMEISHEQTWFRINLDFLLLDLGDEVLTHSAFLLHLGLHCLHYITESWFTPSLEGDAHQSESWLWISIIPMLTTPPHLKIPHHVGFWLQAVDLGTFLTRPSCLWPIHKRTWLHQSPSSWTPPKRARGQRTPGCTLHLGYSDSLLHNRAFFLLSPVNDPCRIAELLCDGPRQVTLTGSAFRRAPESKLLLL